MLKTSKRHTKQNIKKQTYAFLHLFENHFFYLH